MTRRSRPARPAARRASLVRARHRPRRQRPRARTPRAMTLDGTNTWIVSEPDSDLAVVIDPGPLDDGHLRHVDRHRRAGGQAGRADPADPRPPRPRRGRGPLRRADPDEGAGPGPGAAARRRGAGRRGRRSPSAAWSCASCRRPGHTADSLCFHLPADRAVLTGDTVLGRGTTVVAHPDGRLGDYLDSLRRLRSLTVDDGVAHGPAGPRAGAGRRAGRRRVLPRPPRPPARPGGDGGRGRPPHARRRSWPTSTRTWTAPCGRPRSCRCGRSWSTCGEHGLI